MIEGKGWNRFRGWEGAGGGGGVQGIQFWFALMGLGGSQDFYHTSHSIAFKADNLTSERLQ